MKQLRTPMFTMLDGEEVVLFHLSLIVTATFPNKE